jgi:hypothetical protein
MAKDAQKDAQVQGITVVCEVGFWLIDWAAGF